MNAHPSTSSRSLWYVLLALVIGRLLLALVGNGHLGFHRDELDFLDNARTLDWGYVAYPPITPFLARAGLELIGPSVLGMRFIPALAQALSMVLVALMVRDLGGGRWAIVVGTVAAAISPVAMSAGMFFGYISFDFLFWVIVLWSFTRRLRTGDPRWWLVVGLGIGLGMMTKYTMVFLVLAVVAAVFLTSLRRDLRSPWLWGGVGLAVLIFLPNLLWQVKHNFITLDYLRSINARDQAWGRTQAFWLDQLYISNNPATVWLTLIGLGSLAVGTLKRYRALAWVTVVCVLAIGLLRGRGYYTGPLYTAGIAAGAVWCEQALQRLRPQVAQWSRRGVAALLVLGTVAAVGLALPVTPPTSPLWPVVSEINDVPSEMVGWPELVAEVARIYATIPADEQAETGIFAANFGEKGALALYGPAYGLPEAISPGNSSWARGYGDPPPQTVIVVGLPFEEPSQVFAQCEVAGHKGNPYGVANEESTRNTSIFLCRHPTKPWSEIWPDEPWFQ